MLVQLFSLVLTDGVFSFQFNLLLVSALKPKLFCEPRGKNTEQKIKNTKSDPNMKKTKTCQI